MNPKSILRAPRAHLDDLSGMTRRRRRARPLSAVMAALALVAAFVVVPSAAASAVPAPVLGPVTIDAVAGDTVPGVLLLIVDDDGTPVPGAVVDFFVFTSAGTATASFPGGVTQQDVVADANGEVVGPDILLGAGEGEIRLGYRVWTDGIGTGEFTTIVVSAPTVGESIGDPWSGNVGDPYAYTFERTGFPLPELRVVGGALPPGLSLTSDGAVVGTPETAGTFTATIEASNASGATQREVSILIEGALVPPTITAVTPHPAGFEVAFDPGQGATDPEAIYVVYARDEMKSYPEYSWSTSSTDSVLAAGLEPGVSHYFTVVLLTGDNRELRSAEVGPFVAPYTEFPTIDGTPRAGRVGEPYSFQFTMTGVPAPELVMLFPDDESLPPGLRIDAATGRILGTPTQAGTWDLTVGAQNDLDCACLDISITIEPAAVTPIDPEEPPVQPEVPVQPEAPAESETVVPSAPRATALATTGADAQTPTAAVALGLLALVGAVAIFRVRRRLLREG